MADNPIIPDSMLKNWQDGEIVKAKDYVREREVLKVGINTTHEELHTHMSLAVKESPDKTRDKHISDKDFSDIQGKLREHDKTLTDHTVMLDMHGKTLKRKANIEDVVDNVTFQSEMLKKVDNNVTSNYIGKWKGLEPEDFEAGSQAQDILALKIGKLDKSGGIMTGSVKLQGSADIERIKDSKTMGRIYYDDSLSLWKVTNDNVNSFPIASQYQVQDHQTKINDLTTNKVDKQVVTNLSSIVEKKLDKSIFDTFKKSRFVASGTQTLRTTIPARTYVYLRFQETTGTGFSAPSGGDAFTFTPSSAGDFLILAFVCLVAPLKGAPHALNYGLYDFAAGNTRLLPLQNTYIYGDYGGNTAVAVHLKANQQVGIRVLCSEAIDLQACYMQVVKLS
ncbi:hypothetical protein [Paenibacillus larvae]|uniref:Uncharacterized protein n=1 Tax=Paenibacillus larvae subsp. larvae TaxID=147375 RepID=A0A6C0QZ58_9BACL|nr:hypothetical protein [Paenibacillus larvae]QHZ54013.1 hypothetical protein ERICV_05029 [Paenibacillus larvae subsp. larvae]